MKLETKKSTLKVIKNYCIDKVNDTEKYGYPPEPGKRARYHWMCSAHKKWRECSVCHCPIIAKLEKLEVTK